MKKNIIMAMIAAIVSMSMCATNCLSMGDTIRINPNKLDGYSHHAVTMYNDGYCDAWSMAVTYPEGLVVKLVAGVTPLDGMSVPYTDRYGQEQLYTCPLTVSAAYANISSSITAMGYWDYNYDGEFESYGTVKWSAGAHSMFEYNFYIDPEFRSGYVIFDGTISSGYDQRGAVLQGVRFYTRTYVYVGYLKGDLSGDDRSDVLDVTLVIEHILGKYQLDEFQLEAADINNDGSVDIDDVTILTDIILM